MCIKKIKFKAKEIQNALKCVIFQIPKRHNSIGQEVLIHN